MNRRGFSLAELLVSLGIMSVIAALLLPIMTNLRPDKNKTLYLKTYNALASTIKGLAASNEIFPACQGDFCFQRNPLYNSSSGVNDAYPEGNSKLCELLAEQFNASNNTCSDVYQAFNGDNFHFSTQDGEQFFVSTFRTEPAIENNQVSYQTDIYFDINGDKLPNKLYGEDGCENPDRFKLIVASDGRINIADPMGRAYVKTQKSWVRKSVEVDDDGLLAELSSGARDFSVKRRRCPDGYNLEDGMCTVIMAASDNNDDENPDVGSSSVSSTGSAPTPPRGFLSYDCTEAAIRGQGYAYECPNGTVVMEDRDRTGDYREAWETCTELGLRLPTCWEMSAAGRSYTQLGLTSGNYWASYETSPIEASTHNNCYMPVGNCGSHGSSAVQKFRCVKGDWP